MCRLLTQDGLYAKGKTWACNLLDAVLISLTSIEEGRPSKVVAREWQSAQGGGGGVTGGKGVNRTHELWAVGSSSSSVTKAKGCGSDRVSVVSGFSSPLLSGSAMEEEVAHTAWMATDRAKDAHFYSVFRALLCLFPTTLACSKCIREQTAGYAFRQEHKLTTVGI